MYLGEKRKLDQLLKKRFLSGLALQTPCGWVAGWTGRREGVKAVLMFAYSNQNSNNIKRADFANSKEESTKQEEG